MQNHDAGCAVKQTVFEYLQAHASLREATVLDSLDRVFHVLSAARHRGATIYIAGNGGSASTASHWVNDLGKATKGLHSQPIRVMSLSDNISWLTALANDEGYDRVFAGQLENFARPGDVLIVISVSGNSPNLVKAVELAKLRGVVTIGLLGSDGGVLKNNVDDCVWIATGSGAYGQVESCHTLLCHALTDCLARDMGVERPTHEPSVISGDEKDDGSSCRQPSASARVAVRVGA